ncbi:MAG: hypothetical protein N5P05_000429 [Chroococcopsis gigantea SAG 12.99]|nr:hypothetical protein [Chroococcopsis gigantea SAG 12.99]
MNSKKTQGDNLFIGTSHIYEMELWDEEYFNIETQAYIELQLDKEVAVRIKNKIPESVSSKATYLMAVVLYHSNCQRMIPNLTSTTPKAIASSIVNHPTYHKPKIIARGYPMINQTRNQRYRLRFTQLHGENSTAEKERI